MNEPAPAEEPPPNSLSPAPAIYNRIFWLAYLANVSLVTANAMTFRFAEYVSFLGESEQYAGWIVSIGVLAAIAARFVMGQAIDRHGTRKLWAMFSLIFITGTLGFVIWPQAGWNLFVARIAFSTGLAGMFTCSIVHIQNRVPPQRRTEVIASLGSSGFLGMILGSQMGDLLFRGLPDGPAKYWAIFGGAGLLGLFYLVLVVIITKEDVHTRPKETPPIHRLIVRYWPGSIVAVAMMIGITFTANSVFLTRFATKQGLSGVGTFFTAYAITAFIFRVWSRRWSDTLGPHRLVLMGLAGQTVGFLIFPYVTAEWHFRFPAISCGFGHALLFPIVVSEGSGSFPREYRGTGTTIVLGFTEVGAMLTAPLLGSIIDYYGFIPLFYTVAGTAVSVGVLYAFTHAAAVDTQNEVMVLKQEPEQTEPQKQLAECSRRA